MDDNRVTGRIGKDEGDRNFTARLEAELLAGRFRAGEWLKQSDLEQTYGANRFDVRTALIELRARRLIEHVPNRGFRVIDLSTDEREQLIETRVVLETAAAALVAERFDKSDLRDLNAIVNEFEACMNYADMDVLREINGRFHDRLYNISANGTLAQEIRNLRGRGMPGMRIHSSWQTVNGIARSNEDHKEMIRLLEAGDSAGLAAVIIRHLNAWRDAKVA